MTVFKIVCIINNGNYIIMPKCENFSRVCPEYRLYTVVPRLVKFIDQLTNWYVRSNRKRVKVSSHGNESTSFLLDRTYQLTNWYVRSNRKHVKV